MESETHSVCDTPFVVPSSPVSAIIVAVIIYFLLLSLANSVLAIFVSERTNVIAVICVLHLHSSHLPLASCSRTRWPICFHYTFYLLSLRTDPHHRRCLV